MRIITGSKDSGVSISLILESAQFNIPILTTNLSTCDDIQRTAKRLGVSIPRPIYLSSPAPELRDELHAHDNILVDDLDLILQSILYDKGFKGAIIAAGSSLGRIGNYRQFVKPFTQSADAFQ